MLTIIGGALAAVIPIMVRSRIWRVEESRRANKVDAKPSERA